MTDATRSLGEAAKLAGCSTRTLRRYVALGRVSATRVGGPRGALRFTDQDVEDAVSVRLVRLPASSCPRQMINLDGSINVEALPHEQRDAHRPAA